MTSKLPEKPPSDWNDALLRLNRDLLNLEREDIRMRVRRWWYTAIGNALKVMDHERYASEFDELFSVQEDVLDLIEGKHFFPFCKACNSNMVPLKVLRGNNQPTYGYKCNCTDETRRGGFPQVSVDATQ